MTDQVDRTSGLADDRLDRFGFVRYGGVMDGAALGSAALTEQARGHAAKAVVPGAEHRPPRRAGRARAGHEHDRRTAAAFVIVDASMRIFDHARTRVVLCNYSGTTSPEPPNSAGKSLSFGNPSRIGRTVSA